MNTYETSFSYFRLPSYVITWQDWSSYWSEYSDEPYYDVWG